MPKTKAQLKHSPKRPIASKGKVQRKPATVKQKKPESGRAPVVTPHGSAQSDPDILAFGRAIELFNAGRFQAAKQALAKLVSAPDRNLAYSAELRIRICEQRLTQRAK